MRIRVIGLGQIGIRVAANAIRHGHVVCGIDLDPKCLQRASLENASSEVALLVKSPSFALRHELDHECFDLTIICLPTYDTKAGLSAENVAQAVKALASVVSFGEVVSIESTVPIGETESTIRRLLETGSKRVGEDVFLVSAPERIDTSIANDAWSIPRIIGGVTPACTAAGLRVYKTLARELVAVSSSRVAEAAKLLENTYRFVNINFSNQMADMFRQMDLEPNEIIAAAKTKPFGFEAFWPSVGAGGHCVPAAARTILTASARTGAEQTVLQAALKVNEAGVERVERLIKQRAAARILFGGLSYKSGAADFAHSFPIQIVTSLWRKGCNVTATDSVRPVSLDAGVPFVPYAELSGSFDIVIVASWSSDCPDALRRIECRDLVFLTGTEEPNWHQDSKPIFVADIVA